MSVTERAGHKDATETAKNAKHERWKKIWNRFMMTGFGILAASAAIGILIATGGTAAALAAGSEVVTAGVYGALGVGGIGAIGRFGQFISGGSKK